MRDDVGASSTARCEAAVGERVVKLCGAEIVGRSRRGTCPMFDLPSLGRFDALVGFTVCVLVPRSG